MSHNIYFCPEWAKQIWNSNNCTIESCADGKFAVVDHKLQITIAYGTYDYCCDIKFGKVLG